MFRTAFFATAIVSVLALAGCSSPATSDASISEESELQAEKLESLSVVKGAMTPGDTKVVAYQPSEYGPMDHVPYLAMEVTAKARLGNAAAPEKLKVKIDGNFPGTPRLLVVDEEFNVLAGTSGTPGGSRGSVAELEVLNTPGKKLVLVRDEGWVSPMEFELATEL